MENYRKNKKFKRKKIGKMRKKNNRKKGKTNLQLIFFYSTNGKLHFFVVKIFSFKLFSIQMNEK